MLRGRTLTSNIACPRAPTYNVRSTGYTRPLRVRISAVANARLLHVLAVGLLYNPSATTRKASVITGQKHSGRHSITDPYADQQFEKFAAPGCFGSLETRMVRVLHRVGRSMQEFATTRDAGVRLQSKTDCVKGV